MERRHLGDPGVDGRIILSWISFEGLRIVITVLVSLEDGGIAVFRRTRHERQISIASIHNRFESKRQRDATSCRFYYCSTLHVSGAVRPSSGV